MGDLQRVFQTAVDTVKQAIDADQAGNAQQAYDLYLRALERFVHVERFSKVQAEKDMIKRRCEEYFRRAEQLKQQIQNGGPPPSAGAGGAATARPGDKSAEEAPDAETARLQAALQGAVVMEKPNVKWSDVAGLEAAKEALKEAVILPVRFPQLFTGKRKPWRGILLYGPPGTGKSYLAKAVATEAASSFFSVSSSDLVSKWQGESERLVRALFEMARKQAPSIIFIDEIDSLASARGDGQSESSRRIMTEFLVQMQGVGKSSDQILVLGATNIPWGIDSAMRRRFEKRVYIPLPNAPARGRMFQIHLGKTDNSLTEQDFENLSVMSEGMSGSDISVVVREALMQPIRKCREATHFRVDHEGKYHPCPAGTPGGTPMTLMDVPGENLAVPAITYDDFASVMQRTKASVAPEELVRYEEWTQEFGEEGR